VLGVRLGLGGARFELERRRLLGRGQKLLLLFLLFVLVSLSLLVLGGRFGAEGLILLSQREHFLF
jgi:hypothetical protein